MASELKVDTISEKTTGSGVTIDGVLIKDGTVGGVVGDNLLINGGFDIWQRKTSHTSGFQSGSYGYQTVDRFYTSGTYNGTITTSRQEFTLGQTDVPNFPKYYLRLTKSGGYTEGDYFGTRLEDITRFGGQTVTLSFWAKGTSGSVLRPWFQLNYTAYAGNVTSQKDDISLNTSWTKHTITHTFASLSGATIGSGNNAEIWFDIRNGANDTVEIAQMKLEYGSSATDFVARPIGEELALCQRYFYKTFAPETAPAENISADNYIMVLRYTGAGSVSTSQQHPVQMYSSPSITTYNPYAANSSARQLNSGTDRAITLISVDKNKVYFYWSGVDIHSVHLHWKADAEI